MTDTNKAGKMHAPGVMCVIVGSSAGILHPSNRGKIVTLTRKVQVGDTDICGCRSGGSVKRLRIVIWQVSGTGLLCDFTGEVVPYIPVPQANLLPIGGQDLLIAELLEQQKQEELTDIIAYVLAFSNS